jgi:hypothetical protein
LDLVELDRDLISLFGRVFPECPISISGPGFGDDGRHGGGRARRAAGNDQSALVNRSRLDIFRAAFRFETPP